MFHWNWDQTGIFRKLILNETVPGLDLTLVRYLGFVHLVTESGIHLYALMGVALAFWKGIASASRLNIRTSWIMGVMSGFVLCVCAWWLSDWRVGLFRPFISIAVRMCGQIFGFRFQWFGPLVISLVLDILIFGEKSSPGRIHYACAVAGGLWVWNHIRGGRFSHLKMAIVSWFGTAVLDAWELGLISVFTPIWSLISIPLIAGVFFPIIVLGKLGVFFSKMVFDGMNWVMIQLLEIAFSFTGMVVVSHECLIVALGLGFLACFLSLRLRLFILAVTLLIGGFIPVSDLMIQKNVGQGDSLILRKNRHVTLIDTGDQYRVKDAEWMRFLMAHQILKIDEIIFTHLDADHASGVKRLERLIPIGECQIDSRHLVSRESPCRDTSTVEPKSTHSMKVVTLGHARSKKGNSVMTGVYVHTPEFEYLNLGDADLKLESKLLRRLLDGVSTLRSGDRILKVTHHGSRYSLSPELLKTYAPTQAWISVGSRNRYGHPSSHAMQLLLGHKVPIHRTDVEGDLKYVRFTP